MKLVAAALAATVLLAASAAEAGARDLCLTADPPPATAPAQPLRFGITPQLAGTVGGTQGEVAPEDPGARRSLIFDLGTRRRSTIPRR